MSQDEGFSYFRQVLELDIEMESRYTQKTLKAEDVYRFLTAFVEFIPTILDPKEYRESLDLLVKWKALYESVSGDCFDQRLDYSYNHQCKQFRIEGEVSQ